MRDKARVNKVTVQKMIKYCSDIQSLMTKFGGTMDDYISEIAFRYACDMCIWQIGELTTHLSDEFKSEHSNIEWRAIKNLRNIHVHEYESVDYEEMWKILTKDIPELKSQLEKILSEMN